MIYSIQDFQTSSNIGIKDARRASVHISLFITIFFLGIYYIYSVFIRGFVRVSIHNQLWLINIWIILVNIIQGANIWNVAIHVGLATLWILTYSFFSFYIRKFKESCIHIEALIVIMFIFYVFAALYASYNIQKTYNRIAVINMVYDVLVFLPWITLIQNKKKRLLGIIIISVIVLISMKRGAIIALPIMLSMSYVIEGIIKNKKKTYIVRIVGLLSLFFIGLVIFNYLTDGYIISRFTYESLSTGSGRVNLYNIALEDIKNRTFINSLVGKGSGSSVQLLGTGVHNEWIEFLFSFGIIGVFLYFNLFISLVKTNIKLIKRRSSYASAYSIAITYILIVGMFGGIYFVHSTLYIMSFFGAVEGLTLSDAANERIELNKIN